MAMIIDAPESETGPKLNWQSVPDLPPELQPDPGDILLSRAFWPWDELGAQGIPEHWLYMSRKVQGVIAQLNVQTPNGPRLVRANPDGSLFTNVKQSAGDVWVTSEEGRNALINYNVPAVGARATMTIGFDPTAIALIDTIICTLT